MAEQVTAYRASDGALFDTEDQCEQHEISLRWTAHINAFLDSDSSPYRSRYGAARGMSMKSIIAWELFKTKNPDLVEAK